MRRQRESSGLRSAGLPPSSTHVDDFETVRRVLMLVGVATICTLIAVQVVRLAPGALELNGCVIDMIFLFEQPGQSGQQRVAFAQRSITHLHVGRKSVHAAGDGPDV